MISVHGAIRHFWVVFKFIESKYVVVINGTLKTINDEQSHLCAVEKIAYTRNSFALARVHGEN